MALVAEVWGMLELLLFLLVQCPTVGFLVVLGGYVVGNMIDSTAHPIGPLHKYGLLVGLGFVAMAIDGAVSGGL